MLSWFQVVSSETTKACVEVSSSSDEDPVYDEVVAATKKILSERNAVSVVVVEDSDRSSVSFSE